jgi:hypothetical protein
MISLNQIKNIVRDITSDKEWVNDSETVSEYKGIVSGLERLVRHIELTEDSNEDEFIVKAIDSYWSHRMNKHHPSNRHDHMLGENIKQKINGR